MEPGLAASCSPPQVRHWGRRGKVGRWGCLRGERSRGKIRHETEGSGPKDGFRIALSEFLLVIDRLIRVLRANVTNKALFVI